MVGASAWKGVRWGMSFIGPLTPKGNEAGPPDFDSRDGRIGCLELKERGLSISTALSTGPLSSLAVLLRDLRKEEA